ncbi:MAG: hypothetical protein ABUS49_01820 [Acidobacteriota bacterium]
MVLTDTSAESRRAHARLLAEMTPGQRVCLGAALWQAAESLQRASMRRKNPGAEDAEIAFRIAVTRFGPEIARAAWHRV